LAVQAALPQSIKGTRAPTTIPAGKFHGDGTDGKFPFVFFHHSKFSTSIFFCYNVIQTAAPAALSQSILPSSHFYKCFMLQVKICLPKLIFSFVK
jgi:hypothetical protein